MKTSKQISKKVKKKDLYPIAVNLMGKQKLYTNPNMNICMFAEMMQTNRTYISDVINKNAGMNFRTWLAKYRVDYAKELLLKTPKMKMDDLAFLCGFDNRVSMYRHFHHFENMTPNKWLNSQNQ